METPYIHYQIGTNGANDEHRALCKAKGTMTRTSDVSFVTCKKCVKLLEQKGVENIGTAYKN